MRGDKQVGLFDVIKNGYDKDDDLKDLEELMYDNSKEAGNKMSINDMIKSFELNESDKTSKEEETSDYKELLESMRNNEEEDGPSGLAEKTRKQQESVQREEEKYDNLLNTLQTQTLIRKVDDVTRSKGKDSQNSKIKSTDKSDERARELCGEGKRWYDLKRLGKLIERTDLHNKKAHGNMKSFHELRPIPQSQIDRCTNVYPQNPQW